MHKVVKRPKSYNWQELQEVCELKGNLDKSDTLECISNPEESTCKRSAKVWIYTSDGITALCNICYNWLYPCKTQWYRIIKVSDDFNGKL